jgi:small subunit ribosomal protein S9
MVKKTEESDTKATGAAKPVVAKKTVAQEYYYSAGKRKTAVARVRLYAKGKGAVTVNGKPENEYFTVPSAHGVIQSALKLTGHSKNFDVSVKVAGGGMNAQAEAIRHGIARALIVFDETLRGTLKKAGFLTRDARVKERKKPGLKRARRAPQFSKR